MREADSPFKKLQRSCRQKTKRYKATFNPVKFHSAIYIPPDHLLSAKFASPGRKNITRTRATPFVCSVIQQVENKIAFGTKKRRDSKGIKIKEKRMYFNGGGII